MFEMGDVDAQSDDTESNQDLNLSDLNPAFDNDFNDIYYQCRYERYAAFSPSALLNEVLSLCANIDRLQHEKSEVETRLRDAQQHIYNLATPSSVSQNISANDDGNHASENNSRVRSRDTSPMRRQNRCSLALAQTSTVWRTAKRFYQ